MTTGSVKSRVKEVQPQHQKNEDEEEEGDDAGIEEFEKEGKMDTNIPAKRTARDEQEVIEDEDETQLPDDYEMRERVQAGAQNTS